MWTSLSSFTFVLFAYEPFGSGSTLDPSFARVALRLTESRTSSSAASWRCCSLSLDGFVYRRSASSILVAIAHLPIVGSRARRPTTLSHRVKHLGSYIVAVTSQFLRTVRSTGHANEAGLG